MCKNRIELFLGMNWIALTEEAQLDSIRERSETRPQVIFKHSTRCSISSGAKRRLERVATPPEIDFYYLDLIAYRAVSQKIAESFLVPHESPQVLLIMDGECVYDESHSDIDMAKIEREASKKGKPS